MKRSTRSTCLTSPKTRKLRMYEVVGIVACLVFAAQPDSPRDSNARGRREPYSLAPITERVPRRQVIGDQFTAD
jgi:hypothetical protein